jgi:hypothetical protein
MKKYVLLLTILVSIAGLSGNGFSQCPGTYLGIQKPILDILNTKNHPVLEDGTYLAVIISTYGTPGDLMNGLKRIYAQNITNSQFGGDVLEMGLTPTIRTYSGDFMGLEEFEGQSGKYEVTIERIQRSNSPYLPSPYKCSTDPIEDNLVPLPVPQNLKVSFKSGATTPTLRFDPVPGFLSDSSQWYEIRIYDKDYTRIIYSVKIGTRWCGSSNGNPVPCSKMGSNPSVTYDDSRSVSAQTFEDLVPGEEYIFRATLMKVLPVPFGSTLCSSRPCNVMEATNFMRFKVPE